MSISFSATMRDNSNLSAIPTTYKGWKFRSRSEARWAVLFSELGIDFEYEPQGFRIRNGNRKHYYLPDFIIGKASTLKTKNCNVWLEVKGRMKKKDIPKIRALACQSEYPVVVVEGIPSNYNSQIFLSDGSNIKPVFLGVWGDKLMVRDHNSYSQRFIDAARISRGMRFTT